MWTFLSIFEKCSNLYKNSEKKFTLGIILFYFIFCASWNNKKDKEDLLEEINV